MSTTICRFYYENYRSYALENYVKSWNMPNLDWGYIAGYPVVYSINQITPSEATAIEQSLRNIGVRTYGGSLPDIKFSDK